MSTKHHQIITVNNELCKLDLMVMQGKIDQTKQSTMYVLWNKVSAITVGDKSDKGNFDNFHDITMIVDGQAVSLKLLRRISCELVDAWNKYASGQSVREAHVDDHMEFASNEL